MGTFFFRLRRRDFNNVEDPEILGGVLRPLLYMKQGTLDLEKQPCCGLHQNASRVHVLECVAPSGQKCLGKIRGMALLEEMCH